jgi:murein DD-endopeptidase MepM/ murein hydrolase activator NlpD
VISSGQTLFIPGAHLAANEINRVLGKLFIWPTRGSISSTFGMRVSPITGTWMKHEAIDIGNDLMTPIIASMAGRVARVDYDRMLGNYVIIVHEDGFQTLYAHMEAVYAQKGKYVAQGEKIGVMGSTGASTGSHLHFGIYKNGRAVDPLKYLH